MPITSDDIADLIIASTKDLGRLAWTDLSGDLQEYIALPNVLRNERVTFSSGQGIQWNLMTDSNGQAKNKGLFEPDDYNVKDVMTTANIPWRHSNTNYAIEEREMSMNAAGINRVLDLVKTRRSASMIDLAKLMETNFWGKPPSSSDPLIPYGIDTWDVRNAVTGFNGGNPAGFSSGVGGISSVTQPRWRNYTAQYVNITKADLIKLWREAATKTFFRPAIEMPNYNKGSRYGYYMNYDVLGELESILEDQNENLGVDVASMDGQVMFRRTPCTWVPQLDADTQDPVYGINWGVFYACFLEGEYLREGKPRTAPDQHRTQVVDIDLTYNWKCTDRRRLFIINKA